MHAGVRASRKYNPCKLQRFWKSVLVSLKSEVEETGAEIIHGGLPVVKADPVQVAQVFQNLIGNALKYCGTEQPRITVTARKQQHSWLFSVRGNGIGIPAGK